MTQRVQKVLSQWGIASRRKAETMILAGRIKINGQTAKLGDKVDLSTDVLCVDDQVIGNKQRPQLLYILLNKPPGVVSTCADPQNRSTVIDLLPANLSQGTGIHPVGRLDFASSGALILTNDGDLTLGLTHPRYHLPKTYLVDLDRPLTQADLKLWSLGVKLDGRKTLPAKIKLIKSDQYKTRIEIILTEGRNRQIRRVAEQLGYQVLRLHRLAIGSITLKTCDHLELSSGQYRPLETKEINLLKKSFNLNLLN
ncbi:pseudouridine synthase [Chondrocystis sp. NIES-4102]|nr:pseudouridine synthase [Chondrocystis sp. NIES-4102]